MSPTARPRSAQSAPFVLQNPPTPSPTNCVDMTSTCVTYAAFRLARVATAAASSSGY
jgi:hypothetical protein